jgi:hypothetical protein
VVISNLLLMVEKFIIKFSSYISWLTGVQMKTVFTIDYNMTTMKYMFTLDYNMTMKYVFKLDYNMTMTVQFT